MTARLIRTLHRTGRRIARDRRGAVLEALAELGYDAAAQAALVAKGVT